MGQRQKEHGKDCLLGEQIWLICCSFQIRIANCLNRETNVESRKKRQYHITRHTLMYQSNISQRELYWFGEVVLLLLASLALGHLIQVVPLGFQFLMLSDKLRQTWLYKIIIILLCSQILWVSNWTGHSKNDFSKFHTIWASVGKSPSLGATQ